MNSEISPGMRNYLVPVLIVLYTGIGYVFNKLLAGYISEPGASIPFPLTLAASILALVTLAVYLITLRRFDWEMSDWGMTLNKGLWITIIILVLLMAISLIFNLQGDSTKAFGPGARWPLAFILNVACFELVVRALTVNHLIRQFGRNTTGVILAVIISGLLISTIQSPLGHNLAIGAGASFIISALYYAAGNIFLCLFFDVLKPLPNDSAVTSFLMLTVIYFAFALAGLSAKKGISAKTENVKI